MLIQVQQYNSVLTFTLNGNQLTKADMVLLLKILGFDVVDCPKFLKACCDSLSQVEPEEVEMVLADFMTYSPSDKEVWEEIIMRKWLIETYSSPN